MTRGRAIDAQLVSVSFKNDFAVELAPNAILILIGPNNTGKSATLSGIKAILNGKGASNTPVSGIKLKKNSSISDIKVAISSYLRADGKYYDINNKLFDQSVLEIWWEKDRTEIGEFLTGQIVSDLDTRSRLVDCDPAPAFDARAFYAADHPFQHMYREPKLEGAISAVVRRAFKRDLVVHRAAGKVIPVYIGDRPELNDGEDRITRSYLQRVEELEPLESQGDGIRSFVSIVSRVITEARPIQLIDEPEAFLHPPQARLVAESIGSFSADRQTIVATHSSDVLQGLLAAHADRVSVIRLTRAGKFPHASYLESGRVKNLWRDPILRFSNILDGLFHDGVVVAESDADCRFYEAIIGASIDDQHRPDIHFTYSGGKERIPIIVSALIGLGVPVATVVDFDILNNDQPLRKVVEAHGGQWQSVEGDWAEVKKAVESKETFLGADQFRKQIAEQLKLLGESDTVPKQVLTEVRKISRRASPWDNVKDSGVAAISAGEPTVTASRLLSTLRAMGIFVVPVGEMEGFCRSIGGHGTRWVEAVLLRDLATDGELDEARQFVKWVVEGLRR